MRLEEKIAKLKMQMKELAGTGMVEVYNHQALWNNRQMQKVYDAFVDVWGTEKLWVTIDRANLNFPMRAGNEYKGFIHWDYDPETRPQNVQGVLALADQTDANMGGFQCIPWMYRNYDTWKLTQPEDRDRFQPDVSNLEDKIVSIFSVSIISTTSAISISSFSVGAKNGKLLNSSSVFSSTISSISISLFSIGKTSSSVFISTTSSISISSF